MSQKFYPSPPKFDLIRAFPLLLHIPKHFSEGYSNEKHLGSFNYRFMLTIFLWALTVFFIFSNILFLILVFFAFRQVLSEKKRISEVPEEFAAGAKPKLSVLIPSYNENKVIVRTIKAVLNSCYDNLEVIVINDGSSDNSFATLKSEFGLTFHSSRKDFNIFRSPKFSHLIVLDQQNFGKSQSLNHGLQISSGELVATIDADTLVTETAFLQSVHYLLHHPDCKAVGGIVRVLNGAKIENDNVTRGSLPGGLLSLYQTIEYIRAFFGGRMGLEAIGGTALVPGAFSVFEKQALLMVGGFDPQSATEDFEVVIRLKQEFAKQNRPCEIHMISAPVCWTEVPENSSELFHQRVRWQRGLLQTLLKHRWLIGNPNAGSMGMLTLPYLLIFEGLSPLVELLGYIVVPIAYFAGLISPQALWFYLMIGILFYSLMTLMCVHLEEKYYARHFSKKSFFMFLLYSVFENLGYRQFIFLARLRGSLGLFSAKGYWGEHERDKNLHDAPQTESLGLAVMAVLVVAITVSIMRMNNSVEVAPKVNELQQLINSRNEKLARGELEPALADAEALHRLAPDNAVYLIQLAELRQKLGRFDDAAAAWEEISKASTSYEEACPTLGRIYLDAGKADRAFESFKWCYEKLPNNTDVIFFLAREHERRKEYSQAFELYRRGIDLSANYSDMKDGLNRVQNFLSPAQKASQ